MKLRERDVTGEIERLRQEITMLARSAMLIDPARGVDSRREWEKIHDRLGKQQDFLAGIQAGHRKYGYFGGELAWLD